MKPLLCAAMLIVLEVAALADSLPIFTANPTNRLVAPGSTFTLSVAATGAESFQWRQNGVDLPAATNSTLTITNAQGTNSGYYLAVAKNAIGWTPSQMAYVNVTSGGGIVPFSNYTDWAITNESRIPGGFYPSAHYVFGHGYGQGQVTNGIARVVAGPELDQMSEVILASGFPFGPYYEWNFAWGLTEPGYFDGDNITLTNVSPANPLYYRIQITYTNPPYKQISTTMKLTAGGGTNPVPSLDGLLFPAYLEWPDPDAAYPYQTDTNQIRVTGETVKLTMVFGAWGFPKIQWRKDGQDIVGATNLVTTNAYQYSYGPTLTLSNIQPADAGIYDLKIFGTSWIASPRVSVSVFSQNGAGVFQSPRKIGNQFQSDFVGVAGRSYAIECSPNLMHWTNVVTMTNTFGTYIFLHSPTPSGNLFYRSRLLP